MKTLPANKSYQCIFKIIKEMHKESWAYNKVGEYYLGLYSCHHGEDRNIFIVQAHQISRKSPGCDCSICSFRKSGSDSHFGWIDADKVKVIGWTIETPPEEYRQGLIEA